MPAVSIVTPFRDASHFLPGLVANLQQQSWPDWECLLVDHGSKDGGAELARALTVSDSRFRLIELPCLRDFDAQLPAIPRNKALTQVQSELVAFLDVDDLWHPLKLERQLRFHKEHKLELSVTAFARFNNHNNQVGPWRLPPNKNIHSQIRWRNPIPLLTALVNRDLLHQGFPLHPHEDYLLWLEILRDNPSISYGCLPQVLAFYRKHNANISRHPYKLLRWTYGVYRVSGANPAQAFSQLMHWSLSHFICLLRDQFPHRLFNEDLDELLIRPPRNLTK